MANDPPRPKGLLTGLDIDALPSYDTIKVATIHYEYDGFDSDVPQVKAELSAMQHIFLQYGASVRDISIPKGSNAQSFVESQIKSLFQGLSGPGSLAIIIYGGHGNRGGTWTASNDDGSFSVDWKSIDTNIIAGTGVDTFQLIDACHAASFLPSTTETIPDSYSGRGAFSVIASSSAETIAGINELAFTKAVIYTLAPADGAVPANFTPASLWQALPVVNEAFAELSGDGAMKAAILDGSYKPEFYTQASTVSTTSRKISVLSC